MGSGKIWRHQRALIADYASVGSGHHLAHIEKIVSGMFLRRRDFQDVQRMVVFCISDSDSEITLTTERRKIADIEAQLAALDDRKGQAERELSDRNQARRQADQALSLANVEFRRIGTRLASTR